MRATFPEVFNKSGIYKITNKVNGKSYIGKSKNIGRRFTQYYYDLKHRRNRQVNCYLMFAFIKYGIESFSFDMLEECEVDKLSDRELYWIAAFNTIDRNCGYNLRFDSSSVSGVSKETSVKISERLKSEWRSGIRNSHSEKLKINWKERDRNAQSKVMSNLLTKWEYVLETGRVLSYQDLKKEGFSSVLSSFHRKKLNVVTFKGMRVERRKIDGLS